MRNTKDIIRELREDHDLKQTDVAFYLGITQQTYSNYETGDSEFPSRHIVKLAELYHVTTDYILGRVPYQKYLSNLEETLVDSITIGEYLSQIKKLNKNSLRQLLYFTEFLFSKQKK